MNTLELAVSAIQGFVSLLPFIILSALAFWRQYTVLYMFAGGVSVITGCYMPDIINAGVTDNLSLAIGVSFWIFGYTMFAFAFKTLFAPERKTE